MPETSDLLADRSRRNYETLPVNFDRSERFQIFRKCAASPQDEPIDDLKTIPVAVIGGRDIQLRVLQEKSDLAGMRACGMAAQRSEIVVIPSKQTAKMSFNGPGLENVSLFCRRVRFSERNLVVERQERDGKWQVD